MLRDLVPKFTPLVEDPVYPLGIIHSDLFADNCMFVGEESVTVIDFEVRPLTPIASCNLPGLPLTFVRRSATTLSFKM